MYGRSTALIGCCGIAVALLGPACSQQDRTNGEQQVTLTGCLQEGSGRDTFILTELNRVDEPAPSSHAASPNVTNEQLRQAEHSYRVEGDDVALRQHVGKRVRITGQLEDTGDLPQRQLSGSTGDRDNSMSAGKDSREDRDRLDIDQGDLAKVQADSVEQIADACGGVAGVAGP
jgi:hypothetical protein